MLRKKMLLCLVLKLAIAREAAAQSPSAVKRCAADAIAAGTLCLDRYEATVWRVSDPAGANATLVRRIQRGVATRAALVARGATQLGVLDDDYEPCADSGRGCAGEIYAVSLPSETPSSRLTWFQAQEACANSGKRLPTSAEWQLGANGTPDPGPDDGATDCNTGATGTVDATGARTACVSARGAFDMVGNVEEWVADWLPLSTVCVGWADSATTRCASLARARPSSGPVRCCAADRSS